MRVSNNSGNTDGLCLLSLINTRSLEIAKAELRNENRICLYRIGAYWTCFEHSAYFLSKLFPTLETFVINHPDYPFSIVGVSVSDREINRCIKSNGIIKEGIDYLEFSVKDFDLETFGKWHARKVNGFKSALSPCRDRVVS